MSEDLIGALACCALAGLTLVLCGFYVFHQKHYIDKDTKKVTTEIDIPFIGKVTTNVPAIGLCFVGLGFGWFGYELVQKRGPTFVNFEGEVALGDAAK